MLIFDLDDELEELYYQFNNVNEHTYTMNKCASQWQDSKSETEIIMIINKIRKVEKIQKCDDDNNNNS